MMASLNYSVKSQLEGQMKVLHVSAAVGIQQGWAKQLIYVLFCHHSQRSPEA